MKKGRKKGKLPQTCILAEVLKKKRKEKKKLQLHHSRVPLNYGRESSLMESAGYACRVERAAIPVDPPGFLLPCRQGLFLIRRSQEKSRKGGALLQGREEGLWWREPPRDSTALEVQPSHSWNLQEFPAHREQKSRLAAMRLLKAKPSSPNVGRSVSFPAKRGSLQEDSFPHHPPCHASE